MNKKDRILLRVLTILFAIFIILLGFFGWQLGQNVERQASHTQTQIKSVYEDLDLKQEQIELLKLQVKHLIENPPKGEKGDDGVSIKGEDGEDGKTVVEHHETQTVIEKQIAVEPVHGTNGRTPEFALDAITNRLLMRYEGDEGWQLIPVLCKKLTVVCER